MEIQNVKLIKQLIRENEAFFEFQYDYGIYFEKQETFKKISTTTDRFHVKNEKLFDSFGREKKERPEMYQELFEEVEKELALFLLLQD